MRVSLLLLAGLLSVRVGAGDVAAQDLTPQILGWERSFAVSWETVERGGRPHLAGSVANQTGAPAWRVRLLVEGLDASGQVVAQRIDSLTGEVGTFSRRDFDVLAPGPASRYRVRIFAFEEMRP